MNNVERLRSKLESLHQVIHSPALRQALWHLDLLITVQNSLGESLPKTEECFTLIDMVISSSHKFLEQTYRFCSKKDGELLLTSHSLKQYHRELYPDFDPTVSDYPKIVHDLNLGNLWPRYPYTQHANWHLMTTLQLNPPPILDTLVKLAEGQKSLSAKDLKKFIDETIAGACLHAEHLLQKKNPSEVHLPAPIAKNDPSAFSISSIKSLPLDRCSAVSNKLNNFLKGSRLHSQHPGYLYVKQALAALKMLKVSLQRINGAKDIRELSTWATWSLQQLQESIENVLHTLEYFQDGEASTLHELGQLSEKVGLDMGDLSEQFHQLSYKVRYPAEVLVDTFPAQIIDDLEALKEHPELMQGFQLPSDNKPTILWKLPSKDASPQAITAALAQFIAEGMDFLEKQALPRL
jgi:hypothetical protein